MTLTDIRVTDDDIREVARARRSIRRWGVVALIASLTAVVVLIILFWQNAKQGARIDTSGNLIASQSDVITRQADVIDSVCRVAGGQITVDTQAKEACTRAAQGLPPVPTPDASPAANGTNGRDGINGTNGINGINGVGIAFTRPVDRCTIEVGLTNGTVARFGPLCGADGTNGVNGTNGAAGADGASGVPGTPGEPGSAGVGIAQIRASGCSVEVTMTDGSAATVGPFCVQRWTQILADGSQQECTLDTDANAPVYRCTQTAPPTGTTTAEPTTTTPASTTESTPELPIPSG
jgi:hypothetical protein